MAKTTRRLPKILNSLLYSYVEKGNAKYAKTEGKKLFGSHSAYVNALIAKDRGVKPHLGKWKSKGESKALRKKKKVPYVAYKPNLEFEVYK